MFRLAALGQPPPVWVRWMTPLAATLPALAVSWIAPLQVAAMSGVCLPLAAPTSSSATYALALSVTVYVPTASMQATSIETGAPVLQLASVVHSPSPAAPIHRSVQPEAWTVETITSDAAIATSPSRSQRRLPRSPRRTTHIRARDVTPTPPINAPAPRRAFAAIYSKQAAHGNGATVTGRPDRLPFLAVPNTIVMKFGGTSVADAERIKRAARRIVAQREAGKRVVAVL
jgi:hypothetical protein